METFGLFVALFIVAGVVFFFVWAFEESKKNAMADKNQRLEKTRHAERIWQSKVEQWQEEAKRLGDQGLARWFEDHPLEKAAMLRAKAEIALKEQERERERLIEKAKVEADKLLWRKRRWLNEKALEMGLPACRNPHCLTIEPDALCSRCGHCNSCSAISDSLCDSCEYYEREEQKRLNDD